MATSKPEVPIFKLVDNTGSEVQRLCPNFMGLATRRSKWQNCPMSECAANQRWPPLIGNRSDITLILKSSHDSNEIPTAKPMLSGLCWAITLLLGLYDFSLREQSNIESWDLIQRISLLACLETYACCYANTNVRYIMACATEKHNMNFKRKIYEHSCRIFFCSFDWADSTQIITEICTTWIRCHHKTNILKLCEVYSN